MKLLTLKGVKKKKKIYIRTHGIKLHVLKVSASLHSNSENNRLKK